MWFPWWLSGKESACQCKRCRRCEFDPGLGGSPGVENGNQLQYPYLENSMDKGVWQATVCGVTRSWTEVSMHTHTHTYIYIFFPPNKLNTMKNTGGYHPKLVKM